MQEELANIVELSGGTLDKSNNAQVHQAITNMINSANKGVEYATHTAAGTVELATTAEARAGVNVKTAITPATLKDALANGLGPVYATDTSAGTVELATKSEAQAGTDARTVITPATLEHRLSSLKAGDPMELTLVFGG